MNDSQKQGYEYVQDNKNFENPLKMSSSTYLILFSLCILSVYSQLPEQAIPATPIAVDEELIQNKIIPQQHNAEEILQIQQQSQIRQQLNDQLPQWINEQLQQAQIVIDLPITETFSFILQSQEELIFKWDPSKQKELKLIVDVFYLTAQGNIAVIRDAEETQYLQIMARNPNAAFFGLIDKVYRTKILTVDFDTDFKYIKFANKNSQTVLIQIDVQKLQFVVSKGVADDSLTTARTKVSSILQGSKSTQVRREHVYKWQWGFLENEKSHQMRILGLTGVELFSILITACVQMYCLKRLLDNRAVV